MNYYHHALNIDNEWYFTRETQKIYPGKANEFNTDYWLILHHKTPNRSTFCQPIPIGHKGSNNNLAIWSNMQKPYCRDCYKQFPELPNPKTVQDYFTLIDIMDLNINL
jgi:hypothetical protein